MKVQNFADWQEVIAAQSAKLRAVKPYLNEDGKERFEAFHTLEELASVCNNAQELVDWLNSRVALDDEDIANLASKHVAGAIEKLRAIAAQE